MSSRVQKGGTIFRPVAKTKPRASATPAPEGTRTSHASSSQSHMPPPAAATSRDASVASAQPVGGSPEIITAPNSTLGEGASSMPATLAVSHRITPPLRSLGLETIEHRSSRPVSQTAMLTPHSSVRTAIQAASGGTSGSIETSSLANSSDGLSAAAVERQDAGTVPPIRQADSQHSTSLMHASALSIGPSETFQSEYAQSSQWHQLFPPPSPVPVSDDDGYGPFGPPPGAIYPTPPPTQTHLPGTSTGSSRSHTAPGALSGQPPAHWPSSQSPAPPLDSNAHLAAFFPNSTPLMHANTLQQSPEPHTPQLQAEGQAEPAASQQTSHSGQPEIPGLIGPVPGTEDGPVIVAAPITRKRPGRSKGKQKAVEPTDNNEEPRPKRVRKARTQKSDSVADPTVNTGADEGVDGATTSSAKQKRRRTRSVPVIESGGDTGDAGPHTGSPDGIGDDDGDSDSQRSTHPQKRRVSRTPASKPDGRRGRRKKHPTPPPFDATAEPGAEPDPTAVTMADLCEDPGTGRVSSKAAQVVSNYAVWKAAGKARRAALAARLEAKKYGRPEDEDPQSQSQPRKEEGDGPDEGQVGAAEPPPTTQLASAIAAGTAPGLDGIIDEDATGLAGPSASEDKFDYSQSIKTTRFAVQVRIGPNGETVVDDQSLFVDREDEEDETAGYTHIEESELNKFSNSMSHSKKSRGSRWSGEETDMFFDALCQFGENYELISLVLPGRNRTQCKNKFKAEDKRNSNRINWCLNNRQPYDMSTLARLTGKDFSGPTPVIRAPTPLVPIENSENAESGAEKDKEKVIAVPGKKKRKKNKTQELTPDEEIVGQADSFVDLDD